LLMDTMTSAERAEVHMEAQLLGLGHGSEGSSLDRRLRLTRPPNWRPPAPPAPQGAVYDLTPFCRALGYFNRRIRTPCSSNPDACALEEARSLR
jgi:hypothetical protein